MLEIEPVLGVWKANAPNFCIVALAPIKSLMLKFITFICKFLKGKKM